ncbi:MAG: flagellin N-terminal helical domain-containing protein [Planctomycetota bacterium]|jgi:flagellin-like hook-associated protein FlgL
MLSANNEPMAVEGVSETGTAYNGLLNNRTKGAQTGPVKNAAVELTFQELLRAHAAEFRQNIVNLHDGISAIQTAEFAGRSFRSVLLQMKQLVSQADSCVSSTEARAAVQAEFDPLASQLLQISKSITANGTKIFAGAETIDDIELDDGRLISIDSQNLLVCEADLINDPQAAKAGVDNAITRANRLLDHLGAKGEQLANAVTKTEMKIENIFTEAAKIFDTTSAEKTARATFSYILAHPTAAVAAHSDSTCKIVGVILD